MNIKFEMRIFLMKKLLKILPLLCAMGGLVFLVVSCNIFGFTSDAEKTPIEKAEDAIREGNYEKARKALAASVADSTDAMALYLNAKVALLESGVDMAQFLDLIEGQDNLSGGDDLAILDKINDMDNTEQTALYRANMEIVANLKKIWNQKTSGIMEKDDISLDYSISNMMSGVLGLKDTDRNGIINANDFQLDLSFLSDAGQSGSDGFNFDGGSFIDDEGQSVDFNGLEVFLGDWAVGAGKASAVSAGKSGYEPDDINPLLAAVLAFLNDGSESIFSMISDNEDTSFDTEEIKQYIDEIGLIINYYWYDDDIDNDGNNGADEEIINGLDDDGDGLIDEDTDYHPADPTSEPNTQYYDIWAKWSNQ